MSDDIDKLAREEVRVALKRALRRALLLLMSDAGCDQTELAGIAELSRTTVRNVISDSRGQQSASPRLDTIADVLYGLNVPLDRFLALVAATVSADSSLDATEGLSFEAKAGPHLLIGKLIHVPSDGD